VRSRLFNILPVLSLLLCVATIALWARQRPTSTYKYDVWFYGRAGGRAYAMLSGGDYVQLKTYRPWPVDQRPSWQFGRDVHIYPHNRNLVLKQWLDAGISRGEVAVALDDNGVPFTSSASAARRSKRLSPWMVATSLQFPHHHAVGAFATLPALWAITFFWRRTKRWHRVSRGICTACGYDLRATPGRRRDSGVDGQTVIAVPTTRRR
jgi:hypothetical protein